MNLEKIINNAFVNELEKIAKKRDKVIGIGAIGAGAIVIKKSKSLVSGRETLYHGTSKKAYKKILEEGLKAPKKDAQSINSLENHHRVFTTPKKYYARFYAKKSEMGGLKGYNYSMRNKMGTNVIRQVILDQLSATLNPFQKNILSISMPINLINKKPIFDSEMNLKELPYTFKKIDPKYIKQSKHYIPLNIRELSKYIKDKPGSFAKGIGLATVGAGLTGLGVKQLLKKKEEK
jgi:hypothetical protein